MFEAAKNGGRLYRVSGIQGLVGNGDNFPTSVFRNINAGYLRLTSTGVGFQANVSRIRNPTRWVSRLKWRFGTLRQLLKRIDGRKICTGLLAQGDCQVVNLWIIHHYTQLPELIIPKSLSTAFVISFRQAPKFSVLYFRS